MGALSSGMERASCIALAGLDLGSAAAAHNIGECLKELMFLLTAVSGGCPSFTSETTSSSSSGSEGPEGSRRAVNRGTDGVGAVSNIGESQLTLSSFGLLTTNSVSCHCGTVFPDGMMDGAWEEWAGRAIGSMRAALGQGESRETLISLVLLTTLTGLHSLALPD